jgi:hypothetical protein
MSRIIAGLLGVDVTALVEAGAAPHAIINARLEEIERRILALEAQAGEARTAETVEQGSVHEHAVPEGDAP